MVHKNHTAHQKKWVANHRQQYNEYMKIVMAKRRLWKSISIEFLNILL